MPGFDLRREAQAFANELTELLNRTICHGIRISTFPDNASGQAVLGYGMAKERLTSVGLPLTVGHKPCSGYLGLQYRLVPDDTSGAHLMVVSSFMSYCSDQELDRELFHYDYERNKVDGYPEAHLQICATTTVWDNLIAARGIGPRPLEKAHLPVGGRRNRPTLEDIVDFLITENLADGRPGWQAAVEEGRERFASRQLRAAVRRDPEAAEEVLRGLGRIT